MFHGPPQTKVKRELSPSREFSPCGQEQRLSPYGEKCLYNYRYIFPYPFPIFSIFLSLLLILISILSFNFSAFDRKPFAFNKPLTPPSTPASPFGSSTSTATHPVQKRVMPPAQTQTQGPPLLPGPNHSSTPPHQRAQTPLHSQSPPFAVPCPPVNHPDASYSTDHRYDKIFLFLALCNNFLGHGDHFLTSFLSLPPTWAARACWKCCNQLKLSFSLVLSC